MNLWFYGIPSPFERKMWHPLALPAHSRRSICLLTPGKEGLSPWCQVAGRTEAAPLTLCRRPGSSSMLRIWLAWLWWGCIMHGRQKGSVYTCLHQNLNFIKQNQNFIRGGWEGKGREVFVLNTEATCILRSFRVWGLSSCTAHKQEPAPVSWQLHMGRAVGCHCYCHNTVCKDVSLYWDPVRLSAQQAGGPWRSRKTDDLPAVKHKSVAKNSTWSLEWTTSMGSTLLLLCFPQLADGCDGWRAELGSVGSNWALIIIH